MNVTCDNIKVRAALLTAVQGGLIRLEIAVGAGWNLTGVRLFKEDHTVELRNKRDVEGDVVLRRLIRAALLILSQRERLGKAIVTVCLPGGDGTIETPDRQTPFSAELFCSMAV